MRSLTRTTSTVLLLISLTSTACKERSIKEQRIEKGIEQLEETDPPTQPHTDPMGSDSEVPDQSTTNSATHPWSVPSSWALDDTPRAMRLATYTIPIPSGDQEVAVTRFPGQVGSVLANINRWRTQMQLPPITEEQLEDHIDRFTLESPGDAFDGYQARIESDQGVMIAVALFQASINQTWFVRSTLPNPEIADQLQDQIYEFARSIAQ